MRHYVMLGDEEHLSQCTMLIHFADYGTMSTDEAEYLEEWGFVRPKEIPLLPMTQKLLAYELTTKGRKSTKAFRKLWKHIYVPALEIETDVIPDSYLADNAECYVWVFSPERFELERQAGRLQTALKRAVLSSS